MLMEALLVVILFAIMRGSWGASFTLENNCEYNVWPGFLSNAGIATLSTTGFELSPGATRVVTTPTRWSGRLWARTGCIFDAQGKGNCTTGDCGGQLQCDGAGALPPASLAEFTLGLGTTDFYDVSLVDGYNLPMLVVANGGTGACIATGCIADINRNCPKELQVDDGASSTVMACKSACEAFGNPEYCCSGLYANPDTCKPSSYSQLFKSACPRAYSYAFDDKTSTFTCSGADYTVTFCPSFAMASATSSNTSSTASNTSSTAASPVSTVSSAGKDVNNPLLDVSAFVSTSSTSLSAVPTWTLLIALPFVILMR